MQGCFFKVPRVTKVYKYDSYMQQEYGEDEFMFEYNNDSILGRDEDDLAMQEELQDKFGKTKVSLISKTDWESQKCDFKEAEEYREKIINSAVLVYTKNENNC